MQTKIASHFLRYEHPAPVPGADGTDIIALWFRRPISVQKSRQLLDIEVLTQNILASQIDDRAMLGFALLVTIGFNQADVFVLDAVAAGGSDHEQEHRLTFVPAFAHVLSDSIRKI